MNGVTQNEGHDEQPSGTCSMSGRNKTTSSRVYTLLRTPKVSGIAGASADTSG